MTPYFQRLLDKDRLCFLDCETSDGNGTGSLNPHDPKSFMALIQFNVDNVGAKLMRPSNGGIEYLKELIEKDYIFVLHNSAFDLYWMRVKYGIIIDNVYDTMIASQVLNCGKTLPDVASRMFKKTKEDQSSDFDYDDLLKGQIDNKDFVPQNYFDDEDDEGKNFLHNLAATVYRYTENHIELDKEMQLSDWARNPLSAEQVKYAKNDVIYLPEVVEQQLKFIQRHNLERVTELEMKVKPAIIQMKYAGVALDPVLWDTTLASQKKSRII